MWLLRQQPQFPITDSKSTAVCIPSVSEISSMGFPARKNAADAAYSSVLAG